ncbi:hypothetical protein [Acuticoccus kandeliae]|uniref:hypothetical protein n=1 Tax=Acuticoccus kandeliae TaxID=2073160 RepID=UPI000D3EAA02|nr:hypothetical protein [Acuticoccus kandeliae]
MAKIAIDGHGRLDALAGDPARHAMRPRFDDLRVRRPAARANEADAPMAASRVVRTGQLQRTMVAAPGGV